MISKVFYILLTSTDLSLALILEVLYFWTSLAPSHEIRLINLSGVHNVQLVCLLNAPYVISNTLTPTSQANSHFQNIIQNKQSELIHENSGKGEIMTREQVW